MSPRRPDSPPPAASTDPSAAAPAAAEQLDPASSSACAQDPETPRNARWNIQPRRLLPAGPWLWLLAGACLLMAAGALRQAPPPAPSDGLAPPPPVAWAARGMAAVILLTSWSVPALAGWWLLRHLRRTAAVETIDPGAETLESIEPLDYDLDTGARTFTAPGMTTAPGTAEMPGLRAERQATPGPGEPAAARTDLPQKPK